MPHEQIYHVIFKFGGSYRIASSDIPDMHDVAFSKEDALLQARQSQIKRDGDPNFVLDLTHADDAELSKYLR